MGPSQPRTSGLPDDLVTIPLRQSERLHHGIVNSGEQGPHLLSGPTGSQVDDHERHQSDPTVWVERRIPRRSLPWASYDACMRRAVWYRWTKLRLLVGRGGLVGVQDVRGGAGGSVRPDVVR